MWPLWPASCLLRVLFETASEISEADSKKSRSGPEERFEKRLKKVQEILTNWWIKKWCLHNKEICFCLFIKFNWLNSLGHAALKIGFTRFKK